jgi:hypothetical protein
MKVETKSDRLAIYCVSFVHPQNSRQDFSYGEIAGVGGDLDAQRYPSHFLSGSQSFSYDVTCIKATNIPWIKRILLDQIRNVLV